jgi:DNA gyrase subunit A
MAAKAKKGAQPPKDNTPDNKAHILGAGEIEVQPITETLETNYMPYAMSVIMSRAIPEIDGFKPSHRKLLYTMYKMGLLNGPRIKSANIVGRTMQLNPHGDGAIYDALVRLTKGNETLLHPFIDSKGNFGKAYSRNMAYAASRYTEARLEPICAELFRDIEKDTVDFVDNYDSTMKEPTLLPVTFPNILVNPNTGIAVGMASNICSFNLKEVCETTIALTTNPDHDISDTLKAPDFPGGGQLLYDKAALDEIYATGKGSVRVRAKYRYDKANNCIDVYEIPPTTTSEAIIEKIIELVKGGKLKDISDVRDETDKTGLKITIDLKRGVNPEKLMTFLFKRTPLEDSFSCNFNVLIAGKPMLLGAKQLLEEWLAFRDESVRRRVHFDLVKARDRLHLLKGLKKILLDIDKAIKIIRETENEQDVVPNLMIGFGIDEVQAEFVAEIKLRHLNREYILKRLQDIEKLTKDIAEMEIILSDKKRIRAIIADELRDVIKKYGKERRTEIITTVSDDDDEEEENIPSYQVHLFFTREGYFKKITPLSLRMSGEHKLKEGDEIIAEIEADNTSELLFFSDKAQVYKAKASDFEDTKASVLGDFIPATLGMDEGESAIYMAVTKDYEGYMLFFFENGKMAKVDMSAYATKLNRKKLIKAYSDKSRIVAAAYIKSDCEFLLTSSAGRNLLVNTGAISPKSTKDTQGVSVMTLKKGHRVQSVKQYIEGMLANPKRYRTKTLPAAGMLLSPEDMGEQMTL